MPSFPTRPFRSAPSEPVPVARVGARPAPERSSLKILVAGVDKDARGHVEAAVKRAFSGREAEPWSVSLVRLGTLWSVTMRGPGERFRNLSFTAEERRLGEAIAEALAGGSEPAASGPVTSPAAPARAPVQERHVCQSCQHGILVVYVTQPDEAKQLAPVACPHCWAVSQVEVGAWAAVGRDYRAEKA